MRTSLLPLLALLLAGCHGTVSIPGLTDDDDSSAGADDDDGDDDDIAPDDDDIAPDDDDIAPDDDDIAPDDDDAVETCVPVALGCGDTITTSNDAVSSSSAYDSWSCVGDGVTGPEVFFDVDPGDHLAVTLTVTGHDEDLDLFVLAGTCDPSACIDGSWNGGSEPEEVEFEASPGDSYQAVVDGWDGAVSEFTISMTCGGGGDDDDDIAPDDDDATGIDADNDGYETPVDCDDSNPGINPGAAEICDAVDNNCSGDIDDGTTCQGCTQAESSGHTYQFCTGVPVDWNAAENLCFVFGYYLVTVNNEAEDDFIEDHAASALVAGWSIGYTDQGGFGSEGTFYWSAGNGSGYENWATGEPNNSGNWPGEDCVEKRLSFGWEWNDIQCSAGNGYVCELDE